MKDFVLHVLLVTCVRVCSTCLSRFSFSLLLPYSKRKTLNPSLTNGKADACGSSQGDSMDIFTTSVVVGCVASASKSKPTCSFW